MLTYSIDNSLNLHTFVFQNVKTNTSETIFAPLQLYQMFCNFQSIFTSFIMQRKLNNCIFQVYDPQKNQFSIINKPYLVNVYIGLSPIILVKYQQEQCSKQQYNQENNQYRKERNKQRNIREVIESVKKWRQLHLNQNKKINLQEAAKMIGISKKSLDDYFCQLRLGQKYGFRFQQNLDQKIGVLRAFVKKNRVKINRKQQQVKKFNQKQGQILVKQLKNQKHPKKLRLIEENKKSKFIIQKNEQIVNNLQKIQNETYLNSINEQQQISKPYYLSENSQQQQVDHQFYKCFSLIANQPIDPFVPFKAKDYRQKQQQRQLQSDIIQW